MENYQNQQSFDNPAGDGNFMQQNLPNATAVLILGIVSIVGCCTGFLGLIFGIIGWVLAAKDIKLYQANPNAYSNYSNLNTGKILCIIGTVLGAIALISSIYSIFFVYGGWDEYMMAIQEIIEQSQNQQ